MAVLKTTRLAARGSIDKAGKSRSMVSRALLAHPSRMPGSTSSISTRTHPTSSSSFTPPGHEAFEMIVKLRRGGDPKWLQVIPPSETETDTTVVFDQGKEQTEVRLPGALSNEEVQRWMTTRFDKALEFDNDLAVFAIGATGSGKSSTLQGLKQDIRIPGGTNGVKVVDVGVIPLQIEHWAAAGYLVRLVTYSVLGSKGSVALDIAESSGSVKTSTPEGCAAAAKSAWAAIIRKRDAGNAATEGNSNSSRSVLLVEFQITITTGAGQVSRKFHVIDLPGKEFKTDTDPSSVFVINFNNMLEQTVINGRTGRKMRNYLGGSKHVTRAVQAVTDILLRPNTIAVGIACVREEQGDMAYSRAQTTFKMVKAFHCIKHVAAPIESPTVESAKVDPVPLMGTFERVLYQKEELAKAEAAYANSHNQDPSPSSPDQPPPAGQPSPVHSLSTFVTPCKDTPPFSTTTSPPHQSGDCASPSVDSEPGDDSGFLPRWAELARSASLIRDTDPVFSPRRPAERSFVYDTSSDSDCPKTPVSSPWPLEADTISTRFLPLSPPHQVFARAVGLCQRAVGLVGPGQVDMLFQHCTRNDLQALGTSKGLQQLEDERQREEALNRQAIDDALQVMKQIENARLGDHTLDHALFEELREEESLGAGFLNMNDFWCFAEEWTAGDAEW